MKLLLIVYSGPSPNRIVELLEAHDAGGYTELTGARGAGASGRVEGTRAWPGTSTVLFTAVPDDRVAEFETALHAYREHAVSGERLHVGVIPTERFF